MATMSSYSTSNNNNNNVNMAELLAKCEEDNRRLVREKNELMKDFNTRMKVHLEEIRLLKEVNEGLQNDLEELRDLCCYLDDDRHKCRKLAKEWQNFGRYVSSILQTKESSYQEEMTTFNMKHKTILAENNDLKRLCQDFEQRTNVHAQPREFVCTRCTQRILLGNSTTTTRNHERDAVTSSPTERLNHNSTSDHERHSEDDSPVFSPPDTANIFSKTLTGPTKRKKKVSFAEPDESDHSQSDSPKHVPCKADPNKLKENTHGILRNGVKRSHPNGSSSSSDSSDSHVHDVNRAMQVLEIHSRLENEQQTNDPLKDKEVEVLKEMCNVVWRKLSNEPSNGHAENHTSTDSAIEDDIIYEDLL